jgi:hypothetical protein
MFSNSQTPNIDIPRKRSSRFFQREMSHSPRATEIKNSPVEHSPDPLLQTAISDASRILYHTRVKFLLQEMSVHKLIVDKYLAGIYPEGTKTRVQEEKYQENSYFFYASITCLSNIHRAFLNLRTQGCFTTNNKFMLCCSMNNYPPNMIVDSLNNNLSAPEIVSEIGNGFFEQLKAENLTEKDYIKYTQMAISRDLDDYVKALIYLHKKSALTLETCIYLSINYKFSSSLAGGIAILIETGIWDRDNWFFLLKYPNKAIRIAQDLKFLFNMQFKYPKSTEIFITLDNKARLSIAHNTMLSIESEFFSYALQTLLEKNELDLEGFKFLCEDPSRCVKELNSPAKRSP